MGKKFIVGICLWYNFNIRTTFDDWLYWYKKNSVKEQVLVTYIIHGIEHNLDIFTISHTKLLSKYHESTVLAISDKDWTFGGTDHDLWILTLVDKALSDMLMDVELAIGAVPNLEVFSIKFTWGAI